MEATGWVRPPRFPLGDLFDGACHADPAAVIEITESRDLCNCGYARGRCDRFPGGNSADAVRFSVANDAPAGVSVIYVIEKDHVPAEHGTLEYTVKGTRLDGPGISNILDRQVRAFVETYLSRRAKSASV